MEGRAGLWGHLELYTQHGNHGLHAGDGLKASGPCLPPAQAVALLPSSCPPEAISLCQNPAGWGKVAQDTLWCVGAGGEGRGFLPGIHARHTCQGAAEALLATGTFPAHPQSHKTQPRPFLTKEGRGQSTFLQNSLLLCPFLTSLAHREGCCF